MSSPDLDDSDVLQRAAAALRGAHDGQREGSGFTRARILATVTERRRPRLRRWLVLAPLGSALLVGSAWAQSTGSWSKVWQAVATVLPFAQPEPKQPLERRHRAPTAVPPAEPAPHLLPATPTPPEPSIPADPPAQPEPSSKREPPATTETIPSPSTALPRVARTRQPSPASAPSTRSAPVPDPELRRFRAAHELHVQGGPRAAIAAYDEYLQAYPQGRFVPEARYNSALDWIKLGDHAAASRLLQPFAAGTYGGYRRAEAQRLLEALSDVGSQ